MVKNLKTKSSNLQSKMDSSNTPALKPDQVAVARAEEAHRQRLIALRNSGAEANAQMSVTEYEQQFRRLRDHHEALGGGMPYNRAMPLSHPSSTGPSIDSAQSSASLMPQQTAPWDSQGESSFPPTNWAEYYPQFNASQWAERRHPSQSLYETYLTSANVDRARANAETSAQMIRVQEDAILRMAKERAFQSASKPASETKALDYSLKSPEAYTKPFTDFMTANPTVFHAVSAFEDRLLTAGFKKLSERKNWDQHLEKGGKYFVSRNGSSLIAFIVGDNYVAGNGVAMVAGHVDALTARLKPVSNKKTTAGYLQLGVAPYSGGLNATWWDRDLGVGGRVVVKDSKTGQITTKLVKLGWPIARIPTLAPHFGVGMMGQGNQETQMVPIIGLESGDSSSVTEEFANLTLGGIGSFASTQPPKLLKAIAGELSITDYSEIINWELELFDTQPAQTIGLDKEFISAGRIDDKVCSWAAIEGLLAAGSSKDSGIVKLVGVFDDEEIGSQLRQGAKSNFLPSVVERIASVFNGGSSSTILGQTYANSFLVSADVSHAVNPNFLGSYEPEHAPRLNVGLVIAADSNGHMTTDSISTSLLTRIAEKSDNKLQLFMIRNDSRSGGTVGPMLSSATGVRAIDAGIPQLSMHSIRATIGDKDPGLGVKIFAGFFNHFEAVDAEFDQNLG